MQLRQHVDGAGAVEVVADGARAADGNLVARVVPALQRSGLVGRAVVVEQPHGLLIAPHSNCRVALLPLQPLALSERSDVCSSGMAGIPLRLRRTEPQQRMPLCFSASRTAGEVNQLSVKRMCCCCWYSAVIRMTVS